jgi:phospholipid/cholesterol/gamma-HCH transport system permease protein
MDIYKIEKSLLPFAIIEVFLETLRSLFRRRFSWREVLLQLYDFGVGSLGIISLCVTFVGIIMILEYSYHMKLVIQNDSLIPSFAMVMLARELAPAVTALLLTSKMGASTAAELAAMKTTEQLDAYRLLGLNPVDLFVSPRVIASALATGTLTLIGLFLAVVGGLFSATTVLGFSVASYFQSLFLYVSFLDFITCITKAMLFGASIPVISAALGFRCGFGAEGVGLSTTDAVVANSIWIIILDFILTYFFSTFS